MSPKKLLTVNRKLCILFDVAFNTLSMNWIKYITICSLLFLCSCRSSLAPDNLMTAKVRRVISGQTVEVVLTKTSKLEIVRLAGVDAPDLRQSPWGWQAKQQLAKLIVGMPIRLETETYERDRYDRLNAHIWQKHTLVSQQLVQEGFVLANTSSSPKYSKLLIDAQEYARLMGYGIWNPKLAMRQTPNQFRATIKK